MESKKAVLERVDPSVPQFQVSNRGQKEIASNEMAGAAVRQPQANDILRELDRLRKRIEELSRANAAQAQENALLRHSLSQLESRISATARGLNEICNSRIWRSLVLAGKLLLSAAGAAAQAKVLLPSAAKRDRAILGGPSVGPGSVIITSDYPPADKQTVLYGVTEINGWAAAARGIERLTLTIGDRPLDGVEYGLRRMDVADHLPHFCGSQNCGFRVMCNTADFPPGPSTLRIAAISRFGDVSELLCRITIDSRTGYEIWWEQNGLNQERQTEIERQMRLFDYSPLISIVCPVYRTLPEHLKSCIASVRNQVYPNWELLLIDDGSHEEYLTGLLEAAASLDKRIRVYALAENSGIAVATNEAVRAAAGDFVGFLDHDDELAPEALFEIVKELNLNRNWDVFYSDEDKLTPDGQHVDAFFKPDWSPDLLRAVNYVCHFLVCRRSLLDEVGALRSGFDGSQDFDLALRLSERTNRIHRISKVLYHWRISIHSTAGATSQKPEASLAGRRALQEHLDRVAPGAQALELFPSHYRTRYPLFDQPEVEIVIPSGGNRLLEQALDSVLTRTTYTNYRILVVDNCRDEAVRNIVKNVRNASQPIQLLDCRRIPFNFSLLCNRAARSSAAPFLLFLNDDTTIITPDWIETLLEHGQRPEVGAVGALMLFPDDRIQHAGVIMGLYGLAGHAFRFLDSRQEHYFHLPNVVRNCLAVTGACLMVRTTTFFEVGGFEEEHLPAAFQDVDLCLKMHEKGYRLIYTPHAKLYHHESASKTFIAHQHEIDYMKMRWAKYILDDPYYNPNLTRKGEGYTLPV